MFNRNVSGGNSGMSDMFSVLIKNEYVYRKHEKLGAWGSNPQPSENQADTLPTAPHPHKYRCVRCCLQMKGVGYLANGTASLLCRC